MPEEEEAAKQLLQYQSVLLLEALLHPSAVMLRHCSSAAAASHGSCYPKDLLGSLSIQWGRTNGEENEKTGKEEGAMGQRTRFDGSSPVCTQLSLKPAMHTNEAVLMMFEYFCGQKGGAYHVQQPQICTLTAERCPQQYWPISLAVPPSDLAVKVQ